MIAYVDLGGSGTTPKASPKPLASVASPPPAPFRMNAVLGSEAGQRQRRVTVLLEDGIITVTSADAQARVLSRIPYERVRSVTYSQSRDPMWKSPKGPVAVGRSSGGMLGKFGIYVPRHWIVIRTQGGPEFIVLRVEEGQAARVLEALAQRTGRTAERLFQ
jgi:hypothetical protein